ncbi:hypothetical protein [Kribbella sancticallisti]|uniref:hypothetical protein n=1 Tax=Kribbella sancticallisti TaxID=460087 RepID=UPI0031DA2360
MSGAKPRTNATVNQPLDRYLAEADLKFNTLDVYRGYAEKHIRPFLGQEAVALRAQILEDTVRRNLPMPPIKRIATDHNTSVGTAQRAVNCSRLGPRRAQLRPPRPTG